MEYRELMELSLPKRVIMILLSVIFLAPLTVMLLFGFLITGFAEIAHKWLTTQ